MGTIELSVDGMSCQGCVKSVEKALSAADPQAKVAVDLATAKVRIEGKLAREAYVQAIDDAGYTVQ